MRQLTTYTLLAGAALLFCSRPAAAQLGPCAVPAGPVSPDLIMDQNLLKTQIFVSEEQFNSNSCTVVEGAVSKPGKHVLLRFNSSTPNIGATDMYIGDPNQCVGTLFHFSECHQHLHFEDYTAYRLWTQGGYANWVASRDPVAPVNSGLNAQLLAAAVANGDLIVGRKQGFCMIDSIPYAGSPVTPGPAKYLSCNSNQGISVGWDDVYGPQLPDQFIQITGLREGVYVLENQVNPNQLLPESNYANNFAAVTVHYVPKHGNMPATVEVIQ
jgi:hypothetical protein